MTTPKKRVEESPAEAFLSMARQYHLAATTLLPLYQQVKSPLYFLFTHALRDLLEQCHRNGLQVGLDLQNVVQLLESENSRHGFRYFLFEGAGQPEINWLHEVVDELMRVIEKEVSKRPTQRLASAGAVMKIIISKPVKK
jgi:hypothetical protein